MMAAFVAPRSAPFTFRRGLPGTDAVAGAAASLPVADSSASISATRARMASRRSRGLAMRRNSDELIEVRFMGLKAANRVWSLRTVNAP